MKIHCLHTDRAKKVQKTSKNNEFFNIFKLRKSKQLWANLKKNEPGSSFKGLDQYYSPFFSKFRLEKRLDIFYPL